jgi:hypothetical protein
VIRSARERAGKRAEILECGTPHAAELVPGRDPQSAAYTSRHQRPRALDSGRGRATVAEMVQRRSHGQAA